MGCGKLDPSGASRVDGQGVSPLKHYVVISADCHAGPNSPVYRDFLDPQYRDDFDDELAERQRTDRRAPRGAGRRRLHRRRRVPGGVVRRGRRGQQPPRDRPARRLGRRDARPGARQRRRDRRGRVPRSRRRHRHDGRAVRRRLQPDRHAQIPSTCSPAHARTTAGRRELCQDEPGAARRADRRADPRRPRRRDRRDPPRPRRRPHRRRHHPAAVGRPRVVHELPLRPGVGGVRGARSCRCTATRARRRTRGLRRGQRLDERLRLRDDLLHRAPAVVHAAHRRVRAVPRG